MKKSKIQLICRIPNIVINILLIVTFHNVVHTYIKRLNLKYKLDKTNGRKNPCIIYVLGPREDGFYSPLIEKKRMKREKCIKQRYYIG